MSLQHHQRIATMVMIVFCVLTVSGQSDLIVNGDFSRGDSGWNALGVYNAGKATGKVENDAYIIEISAPDTIPWSIQFTQNHLTLESGASYTFSCDLSSLEERTVEVSLSRNGGNYESYSGKYSFSVNPQRQSFKQTFVMQQPTDRDVRLEFNCGNSVAGTMVIRNVRLVRNVDPVLKITSPKAGDQLYEGVPFTVTWSSSNVSGGMKIDLSIDDGSTWRTVATQSEKQDSYTWIPEDILSPWCRLRLTSLENDTVSAMNEGPFEIAPVRELVRNGLFERSSEHWRFNVLGGSAAGGFADGGFFQVSIKDSATEHWQIQLTQNMISLKEGQSYRLSFNAYAASPTDLKIDIVMDRDPYSSYFDTTQRIIKLTSTPKQFVFPFTMTGPSDTNCRLEFDCGKSKGDLYIDDVSLVPAYIASVRPEAGRKYYQSNGATVRTSLCIGRFFSGEIPAHGSTGNGISVQRIDLKGRRCRGNREFPAVLTGQQRQVPGVYVLKRVSGSE